MKTCNRLFAAAVTVATVMSISALMSPAKATTTATPDAAPAAAPTCTVPGQLVRLDQALTRTSARLAQGRPLKIIAFGSSSTEGAGASSPAHTYPSRLEAELRTRFPGRDIVVINRGVGGEDATEMVARLQRSVLSERPDLVIWQVGTNALLEDHALTGEARIIRAGLRRLLATGVDVILIDPQYAPKVLAKSRAGQMVSLLERIGHAAGVGVFHRFSIMRHWREEQKLSFGQFISKDGLHMNDWSYDCTARLLADSIVEASSRPAPAVSSVQPKRTPVVSSVQHKRKTASSTPRTRKTRA
jgi:lysophospholipase L1-like esterase